VPAESREIDAKIIAIIAKRDGDDADAECR